MADRKRRRATFDIRFPVQKGLKLEPVVNTLRHWNTHYKAMHEWEDGRVEVKFDKRVKGYDDGRKLLDFSCPYCDQRLYYSPDSVHRVKGHIRCGFCRKAFGVHPKGQVFVVKRVDTKVATATLLKDKVMKWAQVGTHYLDATILPPRVGDEGVEIELEYWEYDDPAKFDKGLIEFVRQLDESGFEYRRLA